MTVLHFSAVSFAEAGTAEPDMALTVESKTLKASDQTAEFSLNVNVSNNAGFISALFSIEFDSNNFKLKSVRSGDIAQDLKNVSEAISEENPATSPFVISLEGDTLKSDITENGSLVILDFELDPDALPGDYLFVVSCKKSGFINNNLEFIDVKTNTGTVTVKSAEITWGDANDDGAVDIKDIVRLRKYLANYDYSTGTSAYTAGPGADANGDGEIDIKDVIRLRKYLANYDYSTNTSTIPLGKAE